VTTQANLSNIQSLGSHDKKTCRKPARRQMVDYKHVIFIWAKTIPHQFRKIIHTQYKTKQKNENTTKLIKKCKNEREKNLN